MLKFELVQNDKHFNKRFATTEKSPIFQSHKSYKNPLANITKFFNKFIFVTIIQLFSYISKNSKMTAIKNIIFKK